MVFHHAGASRIITMDEPRTMMTQDAILPECVGVSPFRAKPRQSRSCSSWPDSPWSWRGYRAHWTSLWGKRLQLFLSCRRGRLSEAERSPSRPHRGPAGAAWPCRSCAGCSGSACSPAPSRATVGSGPQERGRHKEAGRTIRKGIAFERLPLNRPPGSFSAFFGLESLASVVFDLEQRTTV